MMQMTNQIEPRLVTDVLNFNFHLYFTKCNK